jgi:hypothetical protein
MKIIDPYQAWCKSISLIISTQIDAYAKLYDKNKHNQQAVVSKHFISKFLKLHHAEHESDKLTT